ncbi:transcription elongation factor [Theileria orientalis]|uniref:Transcription elongation factor n=1 Tax=Theileria orientalis TaxID=68886 RepID=A0A976MC59_THEOR|nr:transcription elongation factor [Theileria orientalis]
MVADVIVLKQRIDNLSSTLSKGSFTDSLKNDFDSCLEALESLKVDREVLQTTRIGTSLTKLSKSLENHCKDSSSKVADIIERWKSQLRSVNATNSTKRQKTIDSTDFNSNKEKTVVADFNLPSFSDSLNKNFNSATQSLANTKGERDAKTKLDAVNLYDSNSTDLSDPPGLASSPNLAGGSDQNLGLSQHSTDSLGSYSGLKRDESASNSSLGTGVAGYAAREESKEDDLDLPAYSGPLRSDVVRDKALRYLFRCFLLGQDFGPELNKLNSLVYEIETGLYDHYVVNKNAQKEYNLQLKCISFNFKDIKNTFFNYKVYSGSIPVSELVTMSSLQMASDEKKMQRSVILEQSLEACQSDWAIKNIFLNQKSKGQFKCGKCNSRQTTYYQLQTRSSDEPMTTFVMCLNCKNRWRF